MVEKKAYQRCEGEQSQRLPESVQNEPGHERRGRGKKERERKQEPRAQETKRQRDRHSPNGQAIQGSEAGEGAQPK